MSGGVRIGPAESDVGIYLAALSLFYAVPLAVHLLVTSDFMRRRFAGEWSPNRALLIESSTGALLLCGIVMARSVTTSDFIYFQF